MKVPDKILIERIEGYHTHHIGKYENGNQFLGWVYRLFVKPKKYNGDWPNHTKEYIVLFIFDVEGNLLENKIEYSGTSSKVNYSKQTERLESIIDQRGNYIYTDIFVKLFTLELENQECGLVYYPETESVIMMPGNNMSFCPLPISRHRRKVEILISLFVFIWCKVSNRTMWPDSIVSLPPFLDLFI